MCVVVFPRGRLARDVHERRPEEILQRHEETRLETAAKTHPKTQGLLLFFLHRVDSE